MAMLQELTPENPRGKMRTKTGLKSYTVKLMIISWFFNLISPCLHRSSVDHPE